jgi:hypothetical protein
MTYVGADNSLGARSAASAIQDRKFLFSWHVVGQTVRPNTSQLEPFNEPAEQAQA